MIYINGKNIFGFVPNLILSFYQIIRYGLDNTKVKLSSFDNVDVSFLYQPQNPVLENINPNPINGYISAPRWYGNEKIQKIRDEIAKKISDDSNSVFYYSKTKNIHEFERFLNSWMDKCKGAKDGGVLLESYLINREEGDTPFIISTRFPLFGLAYLNIKDELSDDFKNRFKTWWRIFADYIKCYTPSQLNNHHSWKTYFILLSSIILEDTKLYNYGTQCLHWEFKSAFDKDGTQIFEIERGSKAPDYSALNLEAVLASAELLLQCGDDRWIMKLDKELKWTEELIVNSGKTEKLYVMKMASKYYNQYDEKYKDFTGYSYLFRE